MAEIIALRPRHLLGFATRRPRDGVFWRPPPPGWLKLNVDGSSLGNPGNSGSGGLIRDSLGNWVDGFSAFVGEHKSAFQAEVWAFMYGISLALKHSNGIIGVIIESDCKKAVDMINTWNIRPVRIPKLDVDPEFEEVIHEIKRKIEELEDVCMVRVQHVLREGNSCADSLAKKGSHKEEGFPESVLMQVDYERCIINQLCYTPHPYAHRLTPWMPGQVIPPYTHLPFGMWHRQP